MKKQNGIRTSKNFVGCKPSSGSWGGNLPYCAGPMHVGRSRPGTLGWSCFFLIYDHPRVFACK